MTGNMDKKELRKLKMKERDGLSAETLQAFSDIITDRILALKEYREAETILCYVSCRSEVRTLKLIEEAVKQGKTIGVPKVNGQDMDFYRIDGPEDLEPGYFGVLEPKTDGKIPMKFESLSVKKCLILVPGIAFDRDFNRIGYGKGFYDRFFEKYKDTALIKCGIAFDVQMCDSIETDEFDRPLDMIVTENEILYR